MLINYVILLVLGNSDDLTEAVVGHSDNTSEAAVDTELCLMMFVKAKVVRDEMQL